MSSLDALMRNVASKAFFDFAKEVPLGTDLVEIKEVMCLIKKIKQPENRFNFLRILEMKKRQRKNETC